MITPSALNVLIIGLSVIIFSFMWRMLAAYVSSRNEAMGGAMAAAF
jgi:hypothetical protein